MRRVLAGACLALSAFLSPVDALAQEPQPLPDAACNQGTELARATAPEPADSSVPHERGATGECHHAVPGRS
jgi:hypothetical protein